MVRLVLITIGMIALGAIIGIAIVKIRYASVKEPFIEEFYEKYEFVDPLKKVDKQPIAKLPEGDTFDFGSIETSKSYSHDFVIENAGNEKLVINLVSTTCSCTSSDLKEGQAVVIEPGKKHSITLSWFANYYQEKYTHSAEISTNDPNQERIKLTITGSVNRAVEAIPHERVVSTLKANQTYDTHFDIVSFKHDQFNILDTKVITQEYGDTISLETRSLTEEEISSHSGAKSGYRCNVKVKPGLPIGPFLAEVDVKTDIEGFVPVRFQIKGNAVGNVSFINQSDFLLIEGRNTLKVGIIRQGTTAEAKISLVIRGIEGQIDENSITVKQASPSENVSAEIGNPIRQQSVVIVPVTIKIAGLDKPLIRMGPDPDNLGKIQFATPAPDSPTIDVYLEFSVADN